MNNASVQGSTATSVSNSVITINDDREYVPIVCEFAYQRLHRTLSIRNLLVKVAGYYAYLRSGSTYLA